MDLNKSLITICPSCRKPYEEYQGFPTLLCADCVTVRDKRIEHSETDVQNKIKKDIDRY